MEWLQKALETKADCTQAAVFLGNLAYEYHSQGRIDRAAEILEAARPHRPKDAALAGEIQRPRIRGASRYPALCWGAECPKTKRLRLT